MGSALSVSAVFQPESWTKILPLDAMFERSQPLEIDVGCGKGNFLLARAKAHPETNYLGIERMLKRIRKLDRKIAAASLGNIRLLQIEASYAVKYLFPPESVTAFYIFFPDPWPKRRHHKRRLFSLSFLDSLNNALLRQGMVHIATDHQEYFDFIYEMFRADRRFEPAPSMKVTEEERTHFETIFLEQNQRISRCSFQRR